MEIDFTIDKTKKRTKKMPKMQKDVDVLNVIVHQ